MRSPLDVDSVRRSHAERWPRIDLVAETTSTNADLLATAHGRGEREVLIAEHQTSGRGRLDRVWISPPGSGLLFSMFIRPRVPTTQWGWLPLLTGVALAEAIDDATGVRCALKWPNDLLLGPDQRKGAGILVQSAGDAVVIGVGLNVSTTEDELPARTATSLAIEGARTLDRAELLGATLDRFEHRLARWTETGADPAASGLAAAYRKRCATLGRQVQVLMTDGPPVLGKAVDLDASGRLIIEHDGRRDEVSAGDVEHLRPA